MMRFFQLWWGSLSHSLHSQRSLLLENLALRQQLAVLKHKHPKPKLSPLDKIFWVLVRRFWSTWKQALIVVTPETVVRWHRAGFRLYWSLISRTRKRAGRNQLTKEIRDLIFGMVAENPTWDAPRIHGELLMVGFDVSERTISRWMKRAPRDPDPAKRWITFLRNHKEAIARDGFLHRSHGHLRPALLLLYHQARRPTHSALQRHQTSHNAVDHPTVAGGISF